MMNSGKYLLYLLIVFVCENVYSETFFGKLVLKTPSTEKRHSVFEKNPFVFATRRSTYLKKNGDVFKVHIPAIAQGASANTVSFESVRLPKYFLSKDHVDDNFRLARRNGSDSKFDDSASFYIERRAGIEGSGMLKVFSSPSEYMCVRRDSNVIDSALQAIEKESTEDFKYRCSFYLQKLREENVQNAIKKSIGTSNNESIVDAKPQDTANTIRSLLEEFNKKLEHHQQALLSETAQKDQLKLIESSQKKHKINKASKTSLRRLSTKKASIDQKNHHSIYNLNKQTVTSAAVQARSKSFVKPSMSQYRQLYPNYRQQQQSSNAMYKNMATPYMNNQYVSMFMMPRLNFKTQQSGGVQRNRVPVATARYPQSTNKMPAAAVVNYNKNTKINMKVNSKNFNKNVPQLWNTNMLQAVKNGNKAPLKPPTNVNNVNAKYTTARTGAYTNKQLTRPAAVTNSKLIGPKTPINVHDFQMTHMHREPSLNMDGLMHSVTLPATRSAISSNAKTITNSTVGNNGVITDDGYGSDHSTTRNASQNIFFNTKELNETRIEEDHNTGHDTAMVAHKILDGQTKNKTTAANRTSTTASSLKASDDTKINNSTTTLFHAPQPETSTVVKATKYIKNNATLLNNATVSDVLTAKNASMNQTDNKLDNSTSASLVSANMNSTVGNVTLDTTSSFQNTTNDFKNSSQIINSTIPESNSLKNISQIANASFPASSDFVKNMSNIINSSISDNDSFTNSSNLVNGSIGSVDFLANSSNLINTTIMDNAASLKNTSNWTNTTLDISDSLLTNTSNLVNASADVTGVMNNVNMTDGDMNTTLSAQNNSNSNAITRNKIDGFEKSKKNNTTSNTTVASGNKTASTLQPSVNLKNGSVNSLTNSSDSHRINSTMSVKNETLQEHLNGKNTTKLESSATKNNITIPSDSVAAKKNISSSAMMMNSTSNGVPVAGNVTVGSNPNDVPEDKLSALTDATAAEKDAEMITNPDETVASNPNDLSTKQINTNPSEYDLPNTNNGGGGGTQLNGMYNDDMSQNTNQSPADKVSLLHQPQAIAQLAKTNSTMSFEPSSIDSYTGEKSPVDQNELVLQEIRGAVNKINHQDTQDFDSRVKELEMEDKDPHASLLLANRIQKSNNPNVRNLLYGGYAMNRTLPVSSETAGLDNNDGSTEAAGQLQDNTDDFNGDARSKLPNDHLPTLRREHHVMGIQRNQVEEGEAALQGNVPPDDDSGDKNFHHTDSQLSQEDRENYNELNHLTGSNEHHHYHNDDAMNPPIDHNLANDLHHQHHGVVDTDDMAPSHNQHSPGLGHENVHEFVHHGDFKLPEGIEHHIVNDDGDNDVINDGHHSPIIRSPDSHPTTLYENDHYVPANTKSSAGNVGGEEDYSHHKHLVDETNLQHHTHHVVTVKNEAEKQKMVNGLVDPTKDKCISLQIVNDIANRYRIISSINKHGYTPRGKLFTLKTVFKDPSVHKLVLFKAVDELDPTKELQIDGKSKFLATPSSCENEAKLVHITRPNQKPSVIGCGGSSDSSDCSTKKSSINQMVKPSFEATSSLLNKHTNNVKRSSVAMPPTMSGCVRAYHAKNPLSHSCCVFPFIFGGTQHNGCIASGAKAWCGTTGNVDRDKKWGLCTPPASIPDYNSVSQRPSAPIVCQPFCKIKCLPICPNSCC